MDKISSPTAYDYSSSGSPFRAVLTTKLRTLVAAENMSLNEFLRKANDLDVGDRTIAPNPPTSLGGHNTAFINFYNISKKRARGALGENNRMLFSVEGFDKTDPNAPAPGKVKIEQRINALDRKWNLRAKTSTPQAILDYLGAFLKKVVAEVEPKIPEWEK
jgi:hypothetical protein